MWIKMRIREHEKWKYYITWILSLKIVVLVITVIFDWYSIPRITQIRTSSSLKSIEKILSFQYGRLKDRHDICWQFWSSGTCFASYYPRLSVVNLYRHDNGKIHLSNGGVSKGKRVLPRTIRSRVSGLLGYHLHFRYYHN